MQPIFHKVRASHSISQLCQHRQVGEAGGAEDFSVSFDLFLGAQGFGVVIGEFHCRAAIDF